jgi:selenocysteine-specific elongation factor
VTVVIGTAGHIDHGKTTLLQALTGIDADRLPEERRRGMTIDVGYAHLDLDDGTSIDLVDVPGHDRLVGNMLVGAGEIDAALLVVAADDGPRAQTLEHLALLDALRIAPGLVVITKADLVDRERVAAVTATIADLLAPTCLHGAPIIAASGTTGAGLEDVRRAIIALRDQVVPTDRPPTLAIDRVFSAKGRGVVVTGTLRGGPLATGDRLRVVPWAGAAGDSWVRIRELQVHGTPVERVTSGGRTALNVAGPGAGRLHRGSTLSADPSVVATDRVLVTFTNQVADRLRGRFHGGTAAVDAIVGRSGRDALTLPDGTPAGIVRLAGPIAVYPGDRAVVRRGPTLPPVGAVILDAAPPRGISRRRQDPARVMALRNGDPEARLVLHGAIVAGPRVDLAPDVAAIAASVAIETVTSQPVGTPLPTVRAAVAAAVRRAVTIRRDDALRAASDVLDAMVSDGRLVRDGDRLGIPGFTTGAPDPERTAAMDRLEAALAVPMPPPLGEAARVAGCPPDAVRALEADRRIVVLEPDLAYAALTYRSLAALAIELARSGALTPAAYRDATGTSRRYVMAILEDLDRRAILRRTQSGHVPGPRATADPVVA